MKPISAFVNKNVENLDKKENFVPGHQHHQHGMTGGGKFSKVTHCHNILASLITLSQTTCSACLSVCLYACLSVLRYYNVLTTLSHIL